MNCHINLEENWFKKSVIIGGKVFFLRKLLKFGFGLDVFFSFVWLVLCVLSVVGFLVFFLAFACFWFGLGFLVGWFGWGIFVCVW